MSNLSESYEEHESWASKFQELGFDTVNESESIKKIQKRNFLNFDKLLSLKNIGHFLLDTDINLPTTKPGVIELGFQRNYVKRLAERISKGKNELKDDDSEHNYEYNNLETSKVEETHSCVTFDRESSYKKESDDKESGTSVDEQISPPMEVITELNESRYDKIGLCVSSKQGGNSSKDYIYYSKIDEEVSSIEKKKVEILPDDATDRAAQDLEADNSSKLSHNLLNMAFNSPTTTKDKSELYIQNDISSPSQNNNMGYSKGADDDINAEQGLALMNSNDFGAYSSHAKINDMDVSSKMENIVSDEQGLGSTGFGKLDVYALQGSGKQHENNLSAIRIGGSKSRDFGIISRVVKKKQSIESEQDLIDGQDEEEENVDNSSASPDLTIKLQNIPEPTDSDYVNQLRSDFSISAIFNRLRLEK